MADISAIAISFRWFDIRDTGNGKGKLQKFFLNHEGREGTQRIKEERRASIKNLTGLSESQTYLDLHPREYLINIGATKTCQV
jgi:hypothetical protein